WRTQGGQRSGIIELSACRDREQLPGRRDIVFAAGAGEEAVVPNAMEALRQNVEQKATNKFVRAEGPGALGLGGIAAVVLVAARSCRALSADGSRWRRGECIEPDRRAPLVARRTATWRRRTTADCGAASGGGGGHVDRSSQRGQRRTGAGPSHAA